ncbi:MAG TPA: alpha/beta fold hydrolase [Pirellulales bacterium]|nr:alpha/beta fold hydrolase [Pirellulales bacterium]
MGRIVFPCNWLRVAGMPLFLALNALCSASEPKSDAKPSLTGVWQGTLKVQVIELRVVLHITAEGDGYKATLDSPDQGAKGIPVDRVVLEGETVKLELKKIKASFEGKLADDEQSIQGQWTQTGTLPLEFKRLDKEPDYSRPQEPKRPYPYVEQEVSYKNDAGNVMLTGTLTYLASDAPAPAVLLISGSGPQDRDETIMGHKPFLVLADYLTRRGVVVLRVDDRGIGGSTGDTMASTTEDMASDALAGVAFLKSCAQVDARQIGLLGHSEGGLVAPLVASSSDDVAFIVMLAGTGVPGEEIISRQAELIAKAQGADEAALAINRRLQQRMVQAIKTSAEPAEMEKRLRKIADEEFEEIAADKKEVTTKSFDAQMKLALSPWFRYFLTYDPRPALLKVKCPVLAINGEKDLQVDPRQNLPSIEAALKSGGNPDFQVRELKGLNHLFQHCQTGSPIEYGKIDETFAPEAMELIGDWILSKTARR